LLLLTFGDCLSNIGRKCSAPPDIWRLDFYIGRYETFVPIQDITDKQLQTLLKTSKTDFERKLGISNFDPDCI